MALASGSPTNQAPTDQPAYQDVHYPAGRQSAWKTVKNHEGHEEHEGFRFKSLVLFVSFVVILCGEASPSRPESTRPSLPIAADDFEVYRLKELNDRPTNIHVPHGSLKSQPARFVNLGSSALISGTAAMTECERVTQRKSKTADRSGILLVVEEAEAEVL